MITVDKIMSAPGGPPCHDWTRERVTHALAQLDCSSWTAAAKSARAGRWRVVSLADLRLTAYRVATQAQRIAGMRRSIQIRIEAQHARWPDVDDHTDGVRGELLRWCDGGDVDLRELRNAARRHYADADYADADYADAAAAAVASYANAYAAADAAADAAYAAADAAYAAADAAYAAESLAGLTFICAVLDGAVGK